MSLNELTGYNDARLKTIILSIYKNNRELPQIGKTTGINVDASNWHFSSYAHRALRDIENGVCAFLKYRMLPFPEFGKVQASLEMVAGMLIDSPPDDLTTKVNRVILRASYMAERVTAESNGDCDPVELEGLILEVVNEFYKMAVYLAELIKLRREEICK